MCVFARVILLISAAFTGLAPLPGWADLCASAAQLAGIRDAYVSLARESGLAQQDAAIALLSLHLPAARPAGLAEELRDAGIDLSENRLEQALDDAAEQAHAVISGSASAVERLAHDNNRQWLAGLIDSTGCPAHWDERSDQPIRSNPGIPPPNEEDRSEQSLALILKYVALGLGFALALVGGYFIRKSRTFRKGEMERLPRYSVLVDARIECDNLTTKTRILDISRGGAKIAWEDAPENGTALTLHVGDLAIPSSIVWRNEYYAGLLFDTLIEEPALDTLFSARDEQFAD